jgi:hypothetical protein
MRAIMDAKPPQKWIYGSRYSTRWRHAKALSNNLASPIVKKGHALGGGPPEMRILSPAALRVWARIGGKGNCFLHSRQAAHGGGKVSLSLIFSAAAELRTERREHDSGRTHISCSEYGLSLAFSFQTSQHRLPPVCSINLGVKSVQPLHKFFIDSCGLVSDMAWRPRRYRTLRFGDSYL